MFTAAAHMVCVNNFASHVIWKILKIVNSQIEIYKKTKMEINLDS